MWKISRVTSSCLRCGAWLALVTPAHAMQPSVTPDLILLGGRIITMDSANRVVEAIAIRGERIVAVGTTADVRPLQGANTRVVNLRGRAVTPGLIDAHAHFSGGAVDRMFVLDVGYPAVRSIVDLQTALRRQQRQVGDTSWIEGAGWDEGKLRERRMPSARDLDAAVSTQPVWLMHTTGHYGVANSAALKRAGITRETLDPPGGTIDRDATGAPTGVLKESAVELVTRWIPPVSRAQRERAMAALSREFNAEGMTAAKDPGITDAVWDAYAAVRARGALTVRIFALWHGGQSMADARTLIGRHAADTRPYEGLADARLIRGGVKLFADGSGGARTAWMYDEWNRNRVARDSGNRGFPAFDPDTLRAMIRAYHDAGFHLGVHAIGDRAIDWVVESYRLALQHTPVRGRRHSLIHVNVPTDSALRSMVRLQREFDVAIPEPSATFTWWIGDTYAGTFGPRATRLNPFATFARLGLRWADGSDYNVTPFAARYGIWSAVARRTLLDRYGGDPFGRAEAATRTAALRARTIDAARQLFLDRETGSLEIGKRADLAVWDVNPLTAPLARVKEMRCLLTLLDGAVVYRRADGPFGALPLTGVAR
jgi:predicted amidohydrolase YtcJ